MIKLAVRNILLNKKRNAVITTAIAITVFMITSVLTVGIAVVDTNQRHLLRTHGGIGHIRLTDPTPAQIRQINNMEQSSNVGVRIPAGNVLNENDMNLTVTMAFITETVVWNIFSPAWSDIAGQYPQAENEIMASRELLERLGINGANVGTAVTLTYETPRGVAESEFILSGIYTNYDWLRGGSERVMLVSNDFARTHSTGVPDNVYFRYDGDNMYLFSGGIEVSYAQSIHATIDFTPQTEIYVLMGLIAFLLLIASYLLIFNILNISISQDIRFYGLLKAIGASVKQVRRVVYGQVFVLALIGIPVGLLLGVIAPFIAVPMLAGDAVAVITFSPVIYLGGVGLALAAIITGASRPAQKAEKIPPTEAVKYAGDINTKVKARFPARGKPLRMAFRNISRDRKRAALMLISLSLSVLVFTFISIAVKSMNVELYMADENEGDSDFTLSYFVSMGGDMNAIVFSEELINTIRDLPGVIRANPMTLADAYVSYQPALDRQINRAVASYNAIMSGGTLLNTREAAIENFRCSFYGIDVERLEVFDEIQWDIEAWERGEFAVVISDFPDNFSDLQYINGNMVLINDEIIAATADRRHYREDFRAFPFSIPIGGVMPYYSFYGRGGFEIDGYEVNDAFGVDLMVSNHYLKELLASYGFEPPLTRVLSITSDHDYDAELLKTLQGFVNGLAKDNIWVSLRAQARARAAIAEAQSFLTVIGVSVTIILAMAGVQNFISSMSASLIIRKKEFAVLQSIGMSRAQLLSMLIYEGMIYSVTALFIGIGLGTALFAVIYQQWEFIRQRLLLFSYPVIPVIGISAAIILVCICVSTIMCLTVLRTSVTDRLKEGV